MYAAANWHEREAADMFGIRFEGHPNPVSIYLPDGFEGHPLRKSFPLLSPRGEALAGSGRGDPPAAPSRPAGGARARPKEGGA